MREGGTMPIDKVRGGYRVRSYVTGRLLKRKYRTRRAAQAAARRSLNRSKRKRSRNSRTKRRGY